MTIETSAPTRGPWIEIKNERRTDMSKLSAPTRGPWIEIIISILEVLVSDCRPPHGGRGLK